MRKLQAQQLQKAPYPMGDVVNKIIPAPTGGWNAIDPLAAMDPKYAPIMNNWVPRTGYTELRPGYTAWVQGLASAQVESLMTYRPAGAPEQLFAACNNTIFDVSTQGLPTVQQTSLTSNRWQYVNFTPANGNNYIYMVNGADAPRYYSGVTGWVQPSLSGGPSPNTFIGISVHKRRIWFIQEQSTSAWFLGTDAISGALSQLDVGALFQQGGYLQAIGTLAVQGGVGPQDNVCFFSSRGEVAVYQGTDPTNANAFGLVGVFKIPPPLGRRCLLDLGSDLAVITLQGVIPINADMVTDPSAVRGLALTNKIQNAMLLYAQMGESNFGWEGTHYPAQAVHVFNVPIQQDQNQIQLVQNAITGAWCQFIGWNANCFAVYNDQLYFGDDNGNVNLGWSGSADLSSPIVADMQCAFNYFGDPGRIKRITMVQPFLVTSGNVSPTIAVDVDFGNVSPFAPASLIQPAGGQYDLSLYDLGLYAQGIVQQALWQDVTAEGHSLAIRMKVNLLPSGSGANSVFDTGVFDTLTFDGAGTSTNTLQVNGFNSIMEFGGFV